MGEARAITINGFFYPVRTTALSCFNTHALENVTLELKPQYAYMLAKLKRVDDAYLFLREFEEVCSMMCYPKVPIDTVLLKLFSLL